MGVILEVGRGRGSGEGASGPGVRVASDFRVQGLSRLEGIEKHSEPGFRGYRKRRVPRDGEVGVVLEVRRRGVVIPGRRRAQLSVSGPIVSV